MSEQVWSVIDYVREEVSRQGHDVVRLDGISRVGWMLDAWSFALSRTAGFDPPPHVGHDDIEMIGRLVEPLKNKHGLRTCAVRVGSSQCPPAERVPRLLHILLYESGPHTPLDFYKHFEEIHPFVDGNGRTGKILLNWLSGTLLSPIFPPSNLWGREIRNP